ncbi:DUF6923 family protein [Winogradskyella sediminis]|uniref:DUF6923 family protein n=1 Tax=Winogradskyella sediminis TaxID=1382466 RepID=UPI003AA7FCB3
MKHLYNPKSKTPRTSLMRLVFITTLVLINFYSFGQVLIPNNKALKTKQVPSEDFSSTNAPFLLHKASNYTSLQKANIGEADTPFSCSNGFGYILTNASSSNGNVTGLYAFDLSTNSLSVIKDPIINETTTSQFINGLGYNIVDNYLYGLLQGSNNIVKIDSNGDIELLPVTGLIGNNYPSGDIDQNGILYLYGQGRFVAIDLNPTSPDYLVANVVLQQSVGINDMAFSPVDNNIYMLTSTGARALYKFDTSTNTVSNLGQVAGLESEATNSFGTAYMDSLGNMYVANNVSGNTYKINTPHLGGLTATFYSNLPGVSPGDGARCPSQATKPMAIADSVCITSDITITTLNVAGNDSEGTYPIDITSVQLIDPNTSLPSNSVTIAGQGTFTLGSNGEVTFEALPGFSGTSIEYTIADNFGYTSNPGVISINLNNTEAPIGSATQEFCENENATVADLQVSGENIIWYASENSDNPIDLDTILDNGETYYASQTNAEGCESIDRFAVTVEFSNEIELVAPEETSCAVEHGTVYTIEATFTGTAPFSATGDGQSGTFTDNNDGTTTWVSGPIESVVETYNITIQDKCGSIDLTGASPAECLNTPFNCDDGFAYIIINERDKDNNFISGLYSYNLATHAQTLIKAPLIEDPSQSQFVNGIGYNTLDNNIYGIQQNTNNIVKIDASGNVEYLPIVGPFTIGDYSSGDINDDGILFLYGEDKFVAIDLNPSSPAYLTSTTLLSFNVTINDIVVSPIDGNIYMVTSTTNRKLLRFNTGNNTIDDLGIVTGLGSETTNAFGTAYMDALGNMYIANNSSGTIYRIALPHTGNLNATIHGELIDINPGDGARCPSQLIIPMADDDSICATSDDIDTAIEINVLDNDSAGTYDIDITGVQFIDPVSSAATTTVTIPGQGTFTVSTSGVVTFEAVPEFTGTSVEYIITDIIGTPSMPATITVSLNTTAAPTGNTNQEFCASSMPTVADLTATGDTILWYASATETEALDPTENLIDGNTYYATQTSAEGCESLDRLAVTVTLNADISLEIEEETICSEDNTTYTIVATFSGTAPFTALGIGQPGTWVANNDGTYTWTSDAISANEPYSVDIQDANSCNTITLSGEAAICCEFIVSCPTFSNTTLTCYSELPSQITYSIDEFETLGNGDGMIGDNACGIVEITAQNSPDQNTCNQNVTRTYTIISYEDTNGNGVRDTNETTILNSVECYQSIFINDDIAPTFTVPDDITVECDYDSSNLFITGYVDDEADNCSIDLKATFADTITEGACSGSYVISRAWSLSDDCDNTITKVQTITVQDTTAPTFTSPADITVECGIDVTDLSITGDVTDEVDNCAVDLEATYTDSVEDGSCPGASVITRTWTLNDGCDNTTTHIQTITIQDTTAPTFTGPADITLECDVDITDVSITGDVTDEADNCAVGLEATYTDSIEDGTCPGASVITRTWTLADDCDNTTTHVQTITIQDTTAPTFTGPADITLECDEDISDINITGDVTDEADNCAVDLNATYTDSIEDGSCSGASVITRTWSLTDDCDNITTYIQTITVQDTTAPTFSVPADITIECDEDISDITITGDVTDEADNCTTDLEATYSDSIAEGTCSGSSVVSRTWSLTDDCDNTTTFVQTITVQDTTAPTFTGPADITIECDIDIADVSITGDVTDEADNCAVDLNATYTDSIEDGSCPSASVITRTWTLTDDCDNTSTYIQTITIQDTTAPTFSVPADITIECDEDISDISITGDVTDEADNCAMDLEAIYSDSVAEGTCPGSSIISRTWSLTDDCDNTTTFVQTITIQDSTAPSFNETLPEDLEVECDAVPEAVTLTATDNCGTANVTFSENITNGSCMGEYIIERTWTASDDCGNEAVHTQLISVQDNTAPTSVTAFEETVNVLCDNIPEVPSLVFEDSCSNDIDVSFTEESTQTNNSEDYNITRTWTVTDDCGNEAIFTQTIAVELTNTMQATDANLCIEDSEIDLFDLLSGDFDTNGTWSVVSGDATVNGSLFDPASADVGDYTFMYSIDDASCPADIEVNITLDDDCVVLACGEDDVVISKTVTANGDAYNETFNVTGIEDCGFVIELQIFNRWGAEIYKSNNYLNDWRGESHSSSIGSSGKVPTGTYYYIINLKNSGLEPIAGPIYVATN